MEKEILNPKIEEESTSEHPAQVSQPASQKNLKNPRRVGTTTLGFCLVGLGIVLLMGFFIKDINLLFLLKLSPIVLIFLGCEILFYSLISGHEKMKYDGLSIFLCFLLVITSLGISGGLQVAGAFGFSPERYAAEQRLENQMDNAVCDALVGIDNIVYSNINLYTDTYFDYKNATVENLRESGANCQIHIRLIGDYDSTESFAKSVYSILEKMGSLTKQFEFIRIENNNQNSNHTFTLSGKFLGSLSLENIKNLTETEIYEANLSEQINPEDTLAPTLVEESSSTESAV